MIVPAGEKIAETKSCKSCGTRFHITDRDLEFYEKISPAFGGKKESVPSPTLCPDCRQRRRLAFRNERKLYKRKCDLTGKDIVSIYSPDKPRKVYERSAWWGDGWDPMSYGRGCDFERSFAQQYEELFRVVPRVGLSNTDCENCEFNHTLKECKSCYLCFGGVALEDCLFVSESWKSSDSTDVLWSYMIRDSFGIDGSDNMQSCFFCRSCSSCSGCVFCANCVDCHDCLFCYGLSNRKYCIFNEQYEKESYERESCRLKEDPDFFFSGLGRFSQFIANIPKKAVAGGGTENAIGDTIYDSSDILLGFNVVWVQGGRYVCDSGRSKDLIDCSYVYDCEGLLIDTIEALSSSSVGFSHDITNSSRVFYSDALLDCHDCFACVGLRHKRFCILNKQYAEEEYNELVPRIIAHMRRAGEWGEFFDPSVSPFGYNETVAMEYFPLTKEEAIAQGFSWSDYEAPFPKADRIIPAAKLPEKIADIPDDILNWAIECEVTKRPYRIIKQELEFYRKHGLPVPRRHPDQRHLDRLALRNPRKLYERECDKCHTDMVTTYASDRPERVYCEECYRREIFG